MMEASNIIGKLKNYMLGQIDTLSATNPLIGFTKPLITRIINSKIGNLNNILSVFADETGNIDINGILAEMTESVMKTKQFTVHTSFLGDINIGDGKIIVNLPFIDKNIVFNHEDLENLRNTLMTE